MTDLRRKYEIEVQLHDGRTVGSWSEEWRLECEAKHLLAMPLAKRRQALEVRVAKRGQPAIDRLKDVMASMHRVAKSATGK